MRYLKPERLCLVHRAAEIGGRRLLAITAAYAFPFARPRALLTEAELWRAVGRDLGRASALDAWMPKAKAELLVTGACYPGSPKPVSWVRVALGPEDRRLVDKRLEVFGDRRWTLVGPSDPEPFTRMPIDWTRAFGGKDTPQNPVGRGDREWIDEATGFAFHPLPNVEDARHLLASRDERPPPATFAPWSLDWPVHAERRAKGALEPAHFNVAPKDQRVRGFFEGTEAILVENMHPERRVLALTLPGYRARVLARRRATDGSLARWADLPTNLDTLHLFPHRELGLVFFRAQLELDADERHDTLELAALLDESLESRRDLGELEVAIERAEAHGSAAGATERELLGPSVHIDAPAPSALATIVDPGETAAQAALRQRSADAHGAERERLVREGVDPRFMPAPPSLAPATREARALPQAVDDDLARLALELGLSLDRADPRAGSGAAGPPRFSALGEIERLEHALGRARAAGVRLPEVARRLKDPDLLPSLLDLQQRLYVAYRVNAHLQAPIEPLSPQASSKARAELRALVRGAPRERRDFSGVDLAGEDLRGADLEGAFLEGANLEGANLTGARLAGAVLARANLRGATLDRADLTRANLGRVRASGASMREATLDSAILYEADLSGATLDGADLSRASTLALRADGASLRGVVAPDLVLVRASLRGANLRGARLARAVFASTDARGIDARGVEAPGALFVESAFEGATLADALLDDLRADRVSFERADLRDARLAGASLRGANLAGANLSGANLRKADLTSARFLGASLERAILTEVLAIEADLTGANLAGSHWMLAILHRAVLLGANASGTNLDAADLAGAERDAVIPSKTSNDR